MVFYAAAVFLGGQKTKLFKFEDKAPDGGIGDMAVISILTKGDEQCGGIVFLYQQPRPKSKAWVWVTTPELIAFWGLFWWFSTGCNKRAQRNQGWGAQPLCGG